VRPAESRKHVANESRTAQLAHRHPVAFLSYTRFDDEQANGKLAELRTRLEGELCAQLGKPFTIFQEAIDVEWGAQWQQRLLTSIDETIFFIPLITPSYFESAARKSELSTFLQREQTLLYEELVLPVYWIFTNRFNDELARTVMSRNYVDLRQLRLVPIGNPAIDKAIAEIASRLIKRLSEFNDYQSRITRVNAATITTPKDHDCLAHNVYVTGTADCIPSGVTAWLVVEAEGKFFPQTPITAKNWNATVTIGTRGFGAHNNHQFPIHFIATTKSANDKFIDYRVVQQKLPVWHGLSLPAGARILATVTVRRNDRTSALTKLIGTYDEYFARPLQPTKGTITVTGTASGNLRVTATSDDGTTAWTGTITVSPATGQVTATYREGTGRGTLELEQTDDEIRVAGRDNAAPTKAFYMTWKKRPA
jgi:hypothetical protein